MMAPNKVARAAYSLSLCLVLGQVAASVSEPALSAEAMEGIRHSIEVSAGLDEPGKGSVHGSLMLDMRVSSPTQQIDYSKTLSVTFQDVDLVKGAPWQKVWEESACHERRGYPRFWLDALRGSVTRDDQKTDIDAVPRHLGKLLPKDELKIGQQVAASGDDARHERIYRSKTLSSHLRVDVKLTSQACRP